MNKVVHCRVDSYDVYIGRPSKWGNPFSHLSATLAKFKVNSREEAITKYEEWIRNQYHLIKALPELRGKVLGCWCSPQTCHGDVLVKLVGELEKYAGEKPDYSGYRCVVGWRGGSRIGGYLKDNIIHHPRLPCGFCSITHVEDLKDATPKEQKIIEDELNPRHPSLPSQWGIELVGETGLPHGPLPERRYFYTLPDGRKILCPHP